MCIDNYVVLKTRTLAFGLPIVEIDVTCRSVTANEE